MIIGCILDCKENEKEKLFESIGTEDELIFFKNYQELEQSKYRDEIEVMIGEPPIELLQKMKSLKWLQMTWAGVDMYTRRVGFPENVTLTNASGVFGKIISEYVLAGILTMYRKFFDYREEMKQGGWKWISGEQTLEGKTALILGAGDIGCETARKLKVFDVTTWGIRRVVREKPACFDEMYTMDELDELLPKADLVIATLPGTKQTVNLLSKERMLSMKKNAFLVNVGRGTLIPTDDLVDVLNEGHLGGVLLDVVNPEPLPANHPLRQIERVMLTPHSSGIGWGELSGTREKILNICCSNLVKYKNKEPLNNLVDIKLGYRETQN